MSNSGLYNTYISPYSKATAFEYIYDPNLVVFNHGMGGGSTQTGGFRPLATTDFGSTSISGLNVSVGAVAVTGIASVLVTNTAPINVTGIVLTQVTGSVTTTVSAVAITGSPNVTVNGGFLGITGVPTFINAGGYLGLTGAPLVTIANGVLPVSGTFTATQGPVTIAATSNTGAPLAISGVVQATVTTGPVTIVATPNTGAPLAVSGVTINGGGYVGITGTHAVTISNSVLAVSGIVTATVTTGPVSIVATSNTGAPLAISGVVTATVTQGPISIVATSNTGAPLAVSGVFSATIGNVAVTGGQILANDPTSWALLSGISGSLTSNLTAPAYVTGAVSITNTAPINVTGIILTQVTGTVSSTITNPIGVTGTSTDVNASITGAHPYNFLSIGGRATLPTGAGSATGYNVGDYAMLNINASNGGVYTNQGCLDQTQDFVTCYAASTGVASNNNISGAYGTNVLPNNPTRRSFFVQNLSTGQCWLNFSSSLPTLSQVSIVLKAGVVSGDGVGGSYENMGTYTGPVSISGTSPAWFTAWQL